MTSQSESEALNLEASLKERNPELNILVVSGSKSDKEKADIFKNINTVLEDKNIFIYTPSVEAGVDITIKINTRPRRVIQWSTY